MTDITVANILDVLDNDPGKEHYGLDYSSDKDRWYDMYCLSNGVTVFIWYDAGLDDYAMEQELYAEHIESVEIRED